MGIEYYMVGKIDSAMRLRIIEELQLNKKIELGDEISDRKLSHIIWKKTGATAGYLGEDNYGIVNFHDESLLEPHQEIRNVYKKVGGK